MIKLAFSLIFAFFICESSAENATKPRPEPPGELKQIIKWALVGRTPPPVTTEMPTMVFHDIDRGMLEEKKMLETPRWLSWNPSIPVRAEVIVKPRPILKNRGSHWVWWYRAKNLGDAGLAARRVDGAPAAGVAFGDGSEIGRFETQTFKPTMRHEMDDIKS